MAELWGVLGALAVLVVPLLLACGWLMRGTVDRHGKMPAAKDDDAC